MTYHRIGALLQSVAQEELARAGGRPVGVRDARADLLLAAERGREGEFILLPARRTTKEPALLVQQHQDLLFYICAHLCAFDVVEGLCKFR